MTPPIRSSFEDVEITTDEQAEKLVDNLTEDELSKVLKAANKKMWTKELKSESKEIATKSLEFEKDTFKIDSTWRKETTKWWRKVKINDTGDVTEYIDWDQKWEQIFITYGAFIREVCKAKNCRKEEAEKKYLMTIDELKEKMKDKPDGSEEYKKFFNQEVKDHLAGYWDPNNEEFYDIGERSYVWLAGGYSASFAQNEWFQNFYNRNYGFSGRLLKN